MTEQKIDYLIIGGGVAAARAAITLRQEKAQGRVVIVGDEPDMPYDRPPLTKQYLRGSDWTHEDIHHKDATYYPKHNIEVMTGRHAASLDTAGRTVTLENGEQLAFDKLLLASGSRVRELRVPGADKEGIFYIRTLTDIDTLKQALKQARRVTIIGGGLIGAEVAASLSEKGHEVTVIEMLPIIWSHLFGEEQGGYFDSALAKRGITLIRPVTIDRIAGDKRAEKVITREGHEIEGDIFIVGIGVMPDTRLAEAAGLKVDRGIIVDQYLETSVPDIFAAGDCTRYYSPLYHDYIHSEHIDNAKQQGTYAAKNMLGQKVPFDVVPYAWSDLFEEDMISMEYIGHAPKWDKSITIGNPDTNKFITLYGVDNKCMAALLVNSMDHLKPLRELLKQGGSLDEAEAIAQSTPKE